MIRASILLLHSHQDVRIFDVVLDGVGNRVMAFIGMSSCQILFLFLEAVVVILISFLQCFALAIRILRNFSKPGVFDGFFKLNLVVMIVGSPVYLLCHLTHILFIQYSHVLFSHFSFLPIFFLIIENLRFHHYCWVELSFHIFLQLFLLDFIGVNKM